MPQERTQERDRTAEIEATRSNSLPFGGGEPVENHVDKKVTIFDI
jgi:hypothetical protein